MKLRRRLPLFVFLALLTIPALVVLAGPGEGTFSSSINSARQSEGLAPLASHSTLVAHARTHSEEMAASNSIYHSSTSVLKSLVPGWTAIGENVGRGPDAPSIFSAFMNSSPHRANILGDYTHMGVGTAEDADGILYVTIVFIKLPDDSTTTTSTSTSTSTSTTTTSTTTPTTTTKPPPTTTSSTDGTTTTTEPSTTTVAPPSLSTGEALGCALSGLGTGDPTNRSSEALVTTCEEAAAAAAGWPAGTSIDGSSTDDGILLMFFPPPETTTSSSVSTTSPTPTTTTEITVEVDGPAIDFTQPAAPGAADLIRTVAGSVLVILGLVALLALFRRRRDS